MAVAFDAVGPSSAGVKSLASTTLSWTHTCVGSGVALLVGVALGIGGDAGVSVTAKLDPSGANTTIPTLGAAIHSGNTNLGFVQLFGLPDVSSGAHTITLTVAGGTPISLNGGSVSYTGADTTTAFGTQQSFNTQANTTTPGITYTGSTAGNMVAAVLGHGSSITSVTAGTSRWISNDNASSAAGNGAMADIAAGGSVTITWSTASDWPGIAAVEVLAASSTTDLSINSLRLQPKIIGNPFIGDIGRGFGPGVTTYPPQPAIPMVLWYAEPAVDSRAQTGTCSTAAAGTSVAKKVAAPVGTSTTAAAGTSVAKKVAAPVGTSTTAAAGTSVAKKVAAPVGTSTAAAAATGVETASTVSTGAPARPIVSTAARDVAAARYRIPLPAIIDFGPSGTIDVLPVNGSLFAAATTTATDKKVAVQKGTCSVAALATSTETAGTASTALPMLTTPAMASW